MKILNPLRLAISMLTRLPCATSHIEDSDWRISPAFYPICGLIVGGISMIPVIAILFVNAGSFSNFTLYLLLAVIYTSVSAWFTRGFHLDGFCDACDAYSAMTEDKVKRLEIMKDPHPGTTAITALILLLLIKTAAVGLIIDIFSPDKVEHFTPTFTNCAEFNRHIMYFLPTAIVLTASVFARFAMALLAFAGHYPRETGTGAKIVGKVSKGAIFLALASLLPFVFILPLSISGAMAVTALISMAFWYFSSLKNIGGVTGDILGACCETAETAALVAAAFCAILF